MVVIGSPLKFFPLALVSMLSRFILLCLEWVFAQFKFAIVPKFWYGLGFSYISTSICVSLLFLCLFRLEDAACLIFTSSASSSWIRFYELEFFLWPQDKPFESLLRGWPGKHTFVGRIICWFCCFNLCFCLNSSSMLWSLASCFDCPK